MKIVKGILSSLVLFIFGLEVGGFTVWYLIMDELSTYRRSESTSRKRPSYTYRGNYSNE